MLNKAIYYHIVAWFIFILYEVSFVQLIRWSETQQDILTGYVLPYLINIGLFYIHAHGTLRWLDCIKGWKKIFFVPLVFAELILYLIVMNCVSLIIGWTELFRFSADVFKQPKFIQQLWRGLYFLIFSSAYWTIYKSFKIKKRLKEVEIKAQAEMADRQKVELELLTTQNAFLQAQINPHLLFNTLNFIHNEVQQHSPKASDAIIRLSELMRYALFETRTDGKVLASDELEQIDNLIKINKIRFEEKFAVLFQKEGNFNDVYIPPLILLPFVENVFKYADLKNEENPVRIKASMAEQQLTFQVKNVKKRSLHFQSHGIGIENVRKRLSASYPDKFILSINDGETHFEVKLSIHLNDAI